MGAETLVICCYVELLTFYEMLENFEGEINGQQLTVKNSVLLLGRAEFVRGEKYAMGHHTSPMRCCRITPPTALEASVRIQVGVSG
jgi:hypothetical protein